MDAPREIRLAENEPLRVALLSYRAHPEVGGQGVYVRYLSRALVRQGHSVTVFAGQPYPDLAPGVSFVPLPSLDLYRADDPFRRPALREFKTPIDILEYAVMCTGAFPEPLTFSLRAARVLGRHARGFDVVHDNQSLGYGLLDLARRFPTVATIHHPISIDKRIALDAAPNGKMRLQQRRWFSFVRMQARVARRLGHLISVSESAAADVRRDFRVPAERITVVNNGVDPELFRPLPDVERRPGRIVTVASSDLPSKGLAHLIEAVAKVRTARPAELVIIGKGGRGPSVKKAIARFGLQDAVTTVGRVETLDMVKLYSEAELAVVPSLYEGFSLPAIEAMSCGLPVVATTGSSLDEVIGTGGEAGELVAPGDAGALAAAIEALLDAPERRARMGTAARARVLERFTWEAAGAATAALYRRAITRC
jgi:glycosyltransferase involved in cell wall biosynthesis